MSFGSGQWYRMALAERLPLWEAGMGVVMIDFPDYRGSQSHQNYLLPLSLLIYRGEWLRVNRQGLQGLLYSTPEFVLYPLECN